MDTVKWCMLCSRDLSSHYGNLWANSCARRVCRFKAVNCWMRGHFIFNNSYFQYGKQLVISPAFHWIWNDRHQLLLTENNVPGLWRIEHRVISRGRPQSSASFQHCFEVFPSQRLRGVCATVIPWHIMTMSVPERNSGSEEREEESEDESEIVEESPCGRWQKRKEQVSHWGVFYH